MCDTFLALANSTKNGDVIFGKNSDRPQSEAQLITYSPRTKHAIGEELKCTYISIPQVNETAAVLLSQPWWMFGAEMGVNEYSVAIGNEAVFTKEPLRDTGLLGMDLLRLGLERGKTAKESLMVIIDLLEKYGQGGSCAAGTQGWTYHNSYIITDPKEGYVLDTADKWWIVEKIHDVRSISNNLSIRGKGDLRKNGIIQHAIESGYCKDDNDFDFALIFSNPPIPDTFPPSCRDGRSLQLLNENKGNINQFLMMDFLREHEVGICMHGSFESTASQVSMLRPGLKKSIHWFTASTIPCLSIYKPYKFPVEGLKVMKPGPYAKINPDWFWSKHIAHIKLYRKRSKKEEKEKYIKILRTLENQVISQVNDILTEEEKISDEEFRDKIKIINSEAWKKSEEMIN